MELGVVDDHTPMLKSELGNLKFESLQALGNGGWRLKITSTHFLFLVCVHEFLLENKTIIYL